MPVVAPGPWAALFTLPPVLGVVAPVSAEVEDPTGDGAEGRVAGRPPAGAPVLLDACD